MDSGDADFSVPVLLGNAEIQKIGPFFFFFFITWPFSVLPTVDAFSQTKPLLEKYGFIFAFPTVFNPTARRGPDSKIARSHCSTVCKNLFDVCLLERI